MGERKSEREKSRSEAELASDQRVGKVAVMIIPGSSQPSCVCDDR